MQWFWTLNINVCILIVPHYMCCYHLNLLLLPSPGGGVVISHVCWFVRSLVLVHWLVVRWHLLGLHFTPLRSCPRTCMQLSKYQIHRGFMPMDHQYGMENRMVMWLKCKMVTWRRFVGSVNAFSSLFLYMYLWFVHCESKKGETPYSNPEFRAFLCLPRNSCYKYL